MHTKWINKEMICKELLKYATKGEAWKNALGVMKAAKRLNCLEEATAHMPNHVYDSPSNNPSYKWTDEMLKNLAKLYTNLKTFKKENNKAFKVIVKRGLYDMFCSHLIGGNEYRTDEELIKICKSYTTRAALRKELPNIDSVIRNRKLETQCYSHMDYICYPWTREELFEEIKHYTSRGELKEKNPNIYSTLLKRGLLKEAFNGDSGKVSYPESVLMDVIKGFYPSAKRIRIMKANIPGKPHIKGFECDIFVPELNRGIEFDGIYWHSIEGLTKSKIHKHWPLEDIQNYHQIKDDYFMSKGIKILHIKEEDWIKDKQACIDKCLEFLKND